MENRFQAILLLLIVITLVWLGLKKPSISARFVLISGESPLNGGVDSAAVAFDSHSGQLCHTNSPFMPEGMKKLPACVDLAGK
jgi:hypothetical protein